MGVVCLLLCTLAAAYGGDKVVVTHYGGPDFVIEDGSAVIYVDPLPPNAPNFIRHFRAFRKSNNPVPDVVVITHSHRDHCSPEELQELARLNPKLRVIAPVDTRDALDSVLSPEQLLTPIPKPGKPVKISHAGVNITVYRTLHGWLTDDIVPYSYTFPYHYSYVIETKGYRLLISGDSYDYKEIAGDFQQIDAILWHIYKPSDLFDLQAMRPLFSPSVFIPYHLNIRYGLMQPEMAALTDRYRLQGVNAVYLTDKSHSVTLEKHPGEDGPKRQAKPPAPPIRLTFEIDPHFRGLLGPNTVQTLAAVRNDGDADIPAELAIAPQEGWKVTPLDAAAISRLSPGRDFLCRFRVTAPASLRLDGRSQFALTANLTSDAQHLSKELHFGAGQIYTWNILGPFDNADGQGDSRAYPPEQTVDLRKIYTGRNDAPLRWMPYASRDLHSGYIDMAGLFDIRETFAPQLINTNPKYVRDKEQVAGYAVTYIDSPAERDVVFHAGAPYGLHLFVNGRHVFQMSGYNFNFHAGHAAVPARLNKGRNPVLVKIVRGKLEDWNLTPWMGFSLRVTDPEQRPFHDLGFSLE